MTCSYTSTIITCELEGLRTWEGMFFLLAMDFRGNESRGLARKAIGNHVGTSPGHFQIRQYLSSTYCVPSPGDIIINRYGICLQRTYRDRKKTRAFTLNKMSYPLNRADLGGCGTQHAARSLLHPSSHPRTSPKPRGNLGQKLALREALSEGDFGNLPAVGLEPQGGPVQRVA